MIQLAFVEIRVLGLDGRGAQASELADVFHNVAREMYGWGVWDPLFLRQTLSDYQAKYHAHGENATIDYVSMLDSLFPRQE